MGYVITIFSLIFSGSAHAYLDPGTGSMILQALIASIAAVLTTAGIYWRYFKKIISSILRTKLKSSVEKEQKNNLSTVDQK